MLRDKLRIAVIGAGHWGPNLARNFEEMSQTQLVAVVDRKPERTQKIAERYPNVLIFDSYDKLFDLNLDGVVIATPPATHYRIAKECMEHGLHVLVEKPLTLDSADSEKLIQIAEARKLVLMVGHIYEYNAAIHYIKNLIDSGELGDIYYIDAVRASLGLFQPDINVLWDLAPHDFSIILHLLGQFPSAISANGGSYVLNYLGVHDLVYLHLEFPNGTVSNIRVSWLDPDKTRRFTIVGSKKMLVYDDVGLEKIKVFDKGVDIHPDTDNYGNFQAQYRYGDAVTPHINWTEPLRMECEHFAECIAEGKTAVSDGHNGLRVVKLLEAADHSLHNGGNAVKVEYNPLFLRQEMI
ncbi:gfo/Idh/MocA family oxidoreductase [bacterium]|nr:gfo/Idh/MocA family oxidoreductase [bacterium]